MWSMKCFSPVLALLLLLFTNTYSYTFSTKQNQRYQNQKSISVLKECNTVKFTDIKPYSSRNIILYASDEKTEKTGQCPFSTTLGRIGTAGIISNIVCDYSLYVLKTTGSGAKTVILVFFLYLVYKKFARAHCLFTPFFSPSSLLNKFTEKATSKIYVLYCFWQSCKLFDTQSPLHFFAYTHIDIYIYSSIL